MTTIDERTAASFQPIAPGVELCVLRRHEGAGMTFLVRMTRGATAPRHDHPGGEETYLLEGKLCIRRRLTVEQSPQPDVVLGKGEYAYIPPGETHEGFAEEDSLLLVVAPGGVARVAGPAPSAPGAAA